MIVSRDVIELRRRLVVLCSPGLSAIDADRGAAIVAVDQAIGVSGIDPESVMIAMRRGQKFEALAAIARPKGSRVQNVNRIGRFRVSENVREVPGALAIALIVVDARPAIASVVGPVDAAVFRFD